MARQGLGLLRVILWARWRSLANRLRHDPRHGAGEQTATTLGIAVTVLLWLLLIPIAIGLLTFGTLVGWHLAHDASPTTGSWIALRVTLAIFTLLALLTPLLALISRRGQQEISPLVILPISRRWLYWSNLAGTIAEIYPALALPLLFGVLLGCATGGALGAALLTLLAGGLFAWLLLTLATLGGSAAALVLRHRRWSEWISILVLFVLIALSVLPSLLDLDEKHPSASHLDLAHAAWLPHLPSELATKAIASGSHPSWVVTGEALAVLLVYALAAHFVSRWAFDRLLTTPAAGSASKGKESRNRLWSVPLLNPSEGAMAWVEVRSFVRTVRGKLSWIFSPFLVLVLGLGHSSKHRVLASAGSHGPLLFGIGLIAVACLSAILGSNAFSLNLFAVSGRGLGFERLAPLSTFAWVRGKAVGVGLLITLNMAIALVVAAILSPERDPRVWLSVVCAGFSALALYLPAAVVLSALFPRTVDLASISRGGNAHPAAAMLGMIAILPAALPAASLWTLGWWAEKSWGALIAAIVCLAASLWVANRLLVPIATLVDQRYEHIANAIG